jgi:prepilin-type processing-associated H-X9-DG protein
MILPYMEETSVYGEIGPQTNGDASNWSSKTRPLEVYLCPSAEKPISGSKVQSNYAAISGAFRGQQRIELEKTDCGDIYTNGIFYPASRTKIASITDGTSHTLAVGERLYFFLNWMDGVTYSGKLPNHLTRACTEAAMNIRFPINSNHDSIGYWVGDLTVDPALRKLLQNDLFFASKHSGGANFCLADASVQFISDTIDIEVFKDLATKADGEVITYSY